MHLAKVSRPRWVIGKGKQQRRVDKDTPGARKVNEKSDLWYAVWMEGGRKVRQPLATDKEVASVMMGDLLRQREKGDANMVSQFKEHLERPIKEHMGEYLAALKAQDVSAKHYAEKERQLTAVMALLHTLGDLTADHVEKYLQNLTGSARTKDTYRMSVFSFCRWLVEKERIERNPMEKVARPQGDTVRQRRSLTPEELQKILDTTRQRPLLEFSKIRRGKNKGQHIANMKPAFRAKLEMMGRERALIYLMAVYTGLRRGEIASLQVCHLHLDAKPFPYLELPKELTKNGQKAKLLLVPSYAAELKQWIHDARKQPADNLFSVRNEMVKTLKADMKMANISFKDAQGRQADFHALRMTADTMLGIAGVPARVRQMFMRHSDIRLTLETYDDASLYEQEAAMKALANLELR